MNYQVPYYDIFFFLSHLAIFGEFCLRHFLVKILFYICSGSKIKLINGYSRCKTVTNTDVQDFCGHLPYLFQNPVSNFHLSLEARKSSTDSGILRKLANVENVFRAWTKSLKRTKLYFDDSSDFYTNMMVIYLPTLSLCTGFKSWNSF